MVLSQFDVQLPSSDLFNLNNSNDWSGATFLCDDQPVILFNGNHSDARNESTIMHELSHIILNHSPIIDDRLRHLGLMLRNYDEIHENEANWLGGGLQIPFDGLVTALLNNKSPESIASQYFASVEMAKFRINKSGANQKVEAIKRKRNMIVR